MTVRFGRKHATRGKTMFVFWGRCSMKADAGVAAQLLKEHWATVEDCLQINAATVHHQLSKRSRAPNAPASAPPPSESEPCEQYSQPRSGCGPYSLLTVDQLCIACGCFSQPSVFPVLQWLTGMPAAAQSRCISWYHAPLSLTACDAWYHIALWDNRGIRRL